MLRKLPDKISRFLIYLTAFGVSALMAIMLIHIIKESIPAFSELGIKIILKDQRLLTLNAKAAHLLKQIPETDSPYVFLNPKTGAPYKLHEFYYLHKKILKRARLPWVAFRDLQRQCMEVGI